MPALTSEISIECGGRTFSAHYHAAGQTVVVGGRYGQASAAIGPSAAVDELAQLLLFGLAQAWGRREARVLSA